MISLIVNITVTLYKSFNTVVVIGDTGKSGQVDPEATGNARGDRAGSTK
jgi:hypothetical protein